MIASLALLMGLSLGAGVIPPPPWGTGESAGDDLTIDLVIFGPGPTSDVTSWFGHAALVVKDKKRAKERLYNYGEFSFDELMLARYVLGHLEFWVGERPVEHTFNLYRKQGRTITSLHLALTPAERLDVARFLADNALPENKNYIYDHYTDNCATKPRDVLDRAINARLQAASAPARMTLREHSLRHTAAFVPLAWAIDFMLNDRVDLPITTWEESFLPSELARNVRALGLVASETVNHPEGRTAPEEALVMWPWTLAIGVLFGAGTLRMRRARSLAWWSAAVGACASVTGTLLFAMWAFTDHFITYRNENILLSSPLTLVAALLSFGAARAHGRDVLTPRGASVTRAARLLWGVLAIAAVFALATKALPLAGLRLGAQENSAHLALFVPLTLALAIAWWRAPLPGVAAPLEMQPPPTDTADASPI